MGNWLRISLLLLLGLGLIPTANTLSTPLSHPVEDYDFAKVEPLVKKFCVDCHSGTKPKGKLGLDVFKTEAEYLKRADVLDSMASRLKEGDMPPEGKPRPTEEQMKKLAEYFEKQAKISSKVSVKDPGRVTIRRLNRAEYNNTVRDLLGVEVRPADDFPTDDVGYGFDNIGDVLTMPPILLEKYMEAAEKVLDAALRPDDKTPTRREFNANEFASSIAGNRHPKLKQARLMSENGRIYKTVDVPAAGEYKLRIRVFGTRVGTELPKLIVKIDGAEKQKFDIKFLETDQPNTRFVELSTKLTAGNHEFSLEFANFAEDKKTKTPTQRTLIIERLDVDGPQEWKSIVTPRRRLLSTEPNKEVPPLEAAKKSLAQFAARAYRRPLKEGELAKHIALFEQGIKRGETYEQAMRPPLLAILISPSFLYRAELDSNPDERGSYKLNDYELASRLSYFLWSSMPDETLLELAKEKKINDPKVMTEQVERMLNDWKANALVKNFAGQWLQLRNLENVAPDNSKFQGFNDELRHAMQTETEMFFSAMLKEKRPVMQFLDADFTFVNEPLAKLYGIKDIKGKEFKRVSLANSNRAGILTQASILTITSNPTRTSPVKRGKWVMENILGTPPPEPPPDIPALDDQGQLKGTLRERMEQHSKNPTCAVCHVKMDAIGFGFENFDPIGSWRTKDGAAAIDAGGKLNDKQNFKTPVELIQILKTRSDEFRKCLTEKVLTYACGRGLEASDKLYIQEIASSAQAKGDNLVILIKEVALSEPFRMRKVSTR